MNFKLIVENLTKGKNWFNVDCDDVPYKTVKHIVKMLILDDNVKRVAIYKARRLHYHLQVELYRYIPIWQTFLLRLLCFDDPKRLRLDIRRAEKTVDLIDYIGDVKLAYRNNKLKTLASYKLLNEVSK